MSGCHSTYLFSSTRNDAESFPTMADTCVAKNLTGFVNLYAER